MVTHHGVHPRSVHPKYESPSGRLLGPDADLLNAAYVSDLSELVEQADFWFHGHVHDSFDYRVGKCRVVTNPAGYARDRFLVADIRHVKLENPNFQLRA